MAKSPILLAPKECEVIALLSSHGELYGLQFVEKSDGALGRNTIYTLLGRMEKKGYLKSRAVDDPRTAGLPLRYYQVTGLGERAYRATSAAHMAAQEAFGV